MNKQSATKKSSTPEASPLDRLSMSLDTDMKQVNSLILRHMDSEVALIPQLARYLIAAGGKRIRPLLTLGSAALFDEKKISGTYPLAAAVEFIHTATLLHDDVVDESEERRGKKAANLVFGNQASVLVGDFLFSKSFQLMVESKSLEVLRILSQAAAIIAEGEVLQLATTNDIETELPAYLKVIESKTAALFAASCEVGPVMCNASKEDTKALYEYGLQLGIAFQIIDDTLDYAADPEKLGKNIGDDFREGKMTAPVIFALEKATPKEKEFWERTLGRKEQTEEDFSTAMDILKKYNALGKSLEMAWTHARKAQACLNNLPDSSMKTICHDLAEYTITRNF